MSIRLILLFLSIPMIVTGAVASTMGSWVIPYEVRAIFPISWAADNPVPAFFGSVVVLIIGLLLRPRRTVLVNDFAN